MKLESDKNEITEISHHSVWKSNGKSASARRARRGQLPRAGALDAGQKLPAPLFRRLPYHSSYRH